MALKRAASWWLTASLLLGNVLSETVSAASSGSFIPADGLAVDWGNRRVESFSSVSTINKAAQQHMTDRSSSAPITSSSTSTRTPTPNSPVGTQPLSTSTTSRRSRSAILKSSTSSSSDFNAEKFPPFPTRSSSTPPDVLLQVPTLAVKRIELDVDDLIVDINLNAQIANLVTVNAGVFASIKQVNLTISDVEAELELQVRLGHLTEIVNRVFRSLDLNPLLIATINNVTNILDNVVGQVDGLLGSITRGGTVLNFLIDNLGNIVQQVVQDAGQTVNTIVGNYQQNMTYTGKSQQLPNGLTQKQYKYGPLNSLVNIIFNAAGQLVSAVVVRQDRSGDRGQQPPSSSSGTPAQPLTQTVGGMGADTGGESAAQQADLLDGSKRTGQ